MKSHRFKLYRAYSISFTSSNVDKCFWSWILKDCIKVQEKKKKVVVLCSRSRQSVKFRHFHVMVVQSRQRNVQKSVMYVQSCCYANLTLLLFCRSLCRLGRRCLNSLISPERPFKSDFLRWPSERWHMMEKMPILIFRPEIPYSESINVVYLLFFYWNIFFFSKKSQKL